MLGATKRDSAAIQRTIETRYMSEAGRLGGAAVGARSVYRMSRRHHKSRRTVDLMCGRSTSAVSHSSQTNPKEQKSLLPRLSTISPELGPSPLAVLSLRTDLRETSDSLRRTFQDLRLGSHGLSPDRAGSPSDHFRHLSMPSRTTIYMTGALFGGVLTV
jgi:hypothetical protein